MLRLSDHWVGSRDESNSFEIIFVEVWDNILTYTLDSSWVIMTLWQIYHPYTNAWRQIARTVHQIPIADYDVTYERVNI